MYYWSAAVTLFSMYFIRDCMISTTALSCTPVPIWNWIELSIIVPNPDPLGFLLNSNFIKNVKTRCIVHFVFCDQFVNQSYFLCYSVIFGRKFVIYCFVGNESIYVRIYEKTLPDRKVWLASLSVSACPIRHTHRLFVFHLQCAN